MKNILNHALSKCPITLAGLVLVFLVLPVTSALVYPSRQNVSIIIPCTLGGNICPASTLCNISIQYPNGSDMVDWQVADNLGNGNIQYNITSNMTPRVEVCTGKMMCEFGQYNDTVSFSVRFNPTGQDPSDTISNSIMVGIYFVLGIAILFFVAFLFMQSPPFKWTFFLLSILFMTIGINIISIQIHNETGTSNIANVFDQLGAVCYYMYWFIGGLLLMIWVLTTLASIADRKRMKQAEAVGQPTDFEY